MPQIAGFRGVLPDASKLAEVIATPPGPGELGKQLAAGTRVRDGGRSVYRYHQLFAGPGRAMTRKMLMCAIKLAPWTDGSVRPHEASLPAARDAVLARIRDNAAHTEAVLAGFRDAANEVDRLMRKVENGRPTLEHTTKDGTIHRIWRVQDAELLGKLRHYFAPKKLHVLEGHDRYEAMLAYSDELARKHAPPTYSSANYGLAALVNLDDPVLVTAPRHRIVRGAGKSSADLLAAARQHFIVEKLAGAAKDVGALFAAFGETVAHQPAFVAVFAGEADAWKLTLSPDVSPLAEGVTTHRALQKLDPVVLHGLFIDRLLAKTAQLDTTIDAQTALDALGKGAELALIVRPVPVAQIAHVDELGQLLPAGSTAFHPPIVDGIVAMPIDPDEDLV